MALERIGPGNWAYCVEKAGKNLATAGSLMKDRIETNAKIHYETGAWTSENFNCVNKRILGARAQFNPLIKYAKEAVEAQRIGEFYLTDEIVSDENVPYARLLEQIAEKDAKKPIEKRRVIDLGKAKTHNVPTDAFADDDTIVWLAGGKKPANKYGLFLKNDLPEEFRLQEVTEYHMPLSEKDYARGSWLCGLGRSYRSYFGCCDRFLDYGGGSVFRVSGNLGEAQAQKFSGDAKVRVSVPSLAEILKYSKPYIAQVSQSDFEKGLRTLFQKKK